MIPKVIKICSENFFLRKATLLARSIKTFGSPQKLCSYINFPCRKSCPAKTDPLNN